MISFACSFPVERARRWPKAGMVGRVYGLAFAARLSSFVSLLVSVSVVGKRDSDVRFQKRGILLQGHGFMLRGGEGGAHHV